MSTGRVTALYRYPIKSMQGERVEAIDVTPDGVTGDRSLALLDVATGRIVSAHHPTKWGRLLHCRAWWDGPPSGGEIVAALPDGRHLTAGPALESALCDLLGRYVRFIRHAIAEGSYEIVHPDVDGLAPDGFVARSLADAGSVDGRTGQLRVALDAPDGSLLDIAPIHIVTRGSLQAAKRAHPADGDVRRYRPNIVIDLPGYREGFEETKLAGRTMIVSTVDLSITMPTPRCIMPTLSQHDLDAIAAELNDRPRQTLGFKTPSKALAEVLR